MADRDFKKYGRERCVTELHSELHYPLFQHCSVCEMYFAKPGCIFKQVYEEHSMDALCPEIFSAVFDCLVLAFKSQCDWACGKTGIRNFKTDAYTATRSVVLKKPFGMLLPFENGFSHPK